MTQLEFYKSFQFVAELIIAEALFCLRLNGRSKYFIRLPFALAGVVLFSFLFPIFPPFPAAFPEEAPGLFHRQAESFVVNLGR